MTHTPDRRNAAARVLATLVSLAAAAAPAPAGDPWMTGTDLAATFGGKAIDGHYANGRIFAETFRADGRVEYQERGALIGGRWSVQGETFCTIYDADPTGGCFRVRRAAGANCFEFYFVARTEEQGRRDDGRRPSWTARAWLAGEPATCQDGAAV